MFAVYKCEAPYDMAAHRSVRRADPSSVQQPPTADRGGMSVTAVAGDHMSPGSRTTHTAANVTVLTDEIGMIDSCDILDPLVLPTGRETKFWFFDSTTSWQH
jgi:hypothetical protein